MYSWDSLKEPVNIALIGKYTVLSDAYLSVLKALQHACMVAGLKLALQWVEAQHLELNTKQTAPDKYEESWRQVGDRGRGGEKRKWGRSTPLSIWWLCCVECSPP
jgi:CTP synthase (UTP-ammonia lyase)